MVELPPEERTTGVRFTLAAQKDESRPILGWGGFHILSLAKKYFGGIVEISSNHFEETFLHDIKNDLDRRGKGVVPLDIKL